MRFTALWVVLSKVGASVDQCSRREVVTSRSAAMVRVPS